MKIQAFILAGGKSSRMGTDKGLMLYKGKPLVLYSVEAVTTITADVAIITSNPAYAGFGYPLLEDVEKGVGPAGGVLTALKNARTDYLLVCGCDMPGISSGLIRSMSAELEAAPDVVVVALHQRVEPMLALYRAAILPRWEQLLHRGTRKMTDFFDQLNTRIFEATNDPEFHPEMFRNVNTREDLST